MFAEDGQEGKTWKINYAVHEKLDGAETRFVGLVSLFSLEGGRGLPLPDDLTLTKAQQADTLAIEAAYAFLPVGWGKGYATESVNAMLAEAKRAREVWKPWEKVYVRAMVNAENPASLRVMAKTNMKRRGRVRVERGADLSSGGVEGYGDVGHLGDDVGGVRWCQD